MAQSFFTDSSAWIALLDADDNYHRVAGKIYLHLLREYQGGVMTNLVVGEVYASIRRNVGHNAAVEFLTAIRTSPRYRIILSTAELEAQAETILRKYDDQDFSYVDAVSFALMQERGITDVFTFDHHFDILGFHRIPK